MTTAVPRSLSYEIAPITSETAKQSIESPMPIRKGVRISMNISYISLPAY